MSGRRKGSSLFGTPMIATPPGHPVVLAFTANEEGGLVGAERLAETHAGVIDFAISLDLVGGSGELTLNGALVFLDDGFPVVGRHLDVR